MILWELKPPVLESLLVYECVHKSLFLTFKQHKVTGELQMKT